MKDEERAVSSCVLSEESRGPSWGDKRGRVEGTKPGATGKMEEGCSELRVAWPALDVAISGDGQR